MSSRSFTEAISLNKLCLSCLYRLSIRHPPSSSHRRCASARFLHGGGSGQQAGQAAARQQEDDGYSRYHDQRKSQSTTAASFSDPEVVPRQAIAAQKPSPTRDVSASSGLSSGPPDTSSGAGIRRPDKNRSTGSHDAERSPLIIRREVRNFPDPELKHSAGRRGQITGTTDQRLSQGQGTAHAWPAKPRFTRIEDDRASRRSDPEPQKGELQGWSQLRRRGESDPTISQPQQERGQSGPPSVEERFQRDWGRKRGFVGFNDSGAARSLTPNNGNLTFGARHAQDLSERTRNSGERFGRPQKVTRQATPEAEDRGRSTSETDSPGRRDRQTRPKPAGMRTDDELPSAVTEYQPHDRMPAAKEPRAERRGRDRWSRNVDDENGGPSDSAPKKRLKVEKANRRAEKFATVDGELEEIEEEQRLKAERDRRAQANREKKAAAKAAAQRRLIELPQFVSVGNLATLLKVRAEEFAEKLRDFGFEEVNSEHVLNFENASLIAIEYGYEPMVDRSDSEDLKPRPAPVDVRVLPQRPPVVTIMGHVDHGKTTLLDYLRQSSVAASEHGGITQHIGAFSVPMASGQIITFLDTPGHAAFLSMRQRGATVTDIVILVVAADDSVKPQTIEAIKHARAAKVPIIVAINKVDKDEADIEKVKQDLLVQEIEVEDYGGDIQAIPVSGKTGQGLDILEEAILTQAEILDMRAEQDGAVEGWVLEATTKRAGRVATVLIRRGTLRPGDIIVAGTTWARVRTLKNEAGVVVEEAGPGTPVEIDGWRSQPDAGDEVLQAPTEQKATSVVEYRESKLEQTQAAKDMEAINENRRQENEKREQEKAERQAQIDTAKQAGEKVKGRGKSLTMADAIAGEMAKKELYFIIKADVSGSIEAIQSSLEALPLANQPLTLNILRTGVGPVSEFDIDHIHAVPDGDGFIISFNQHIPPNIIGEAEAVGIKIVDESIIYNVIDNVKAIVESKLPPIVSRRVTGEVELSQVFDINVGGRKTSKVAGCRVRNGSVTKGGKVSVFRGAMSEGKLVFEGIISTLKSQKKNVTEMRKGNECGISFEDWEDFKAGDTIQCYEERSEPRRL